MWGLSTGLRDALPTVVWGSMFTSPVIEIRDGTRPASANDAVTGNLLATIALPTSSYFTSAGGVITQNGTWSGTISASGSPTWFRLKNAADTGGYSTTNRRLDGDVGEEGELRLPPSVNALDTLTFTGFTIGAFEQPMTMTGFAGVIHSGGAAHSVTATVAADGTVTPP